MSRLHGDGLGLPISGIGGGPIAYTPVVTWTGNTITTQSGFYLKTPGLLQVWVSFVESAGTASAVVTVTIPTGYTAVTMAGSLATAVGTLVCTSNNSIFELSAAAGATTSVATVNTVNGVVTTWLATMQIPTLT